MNVESETDNTNLPGDSDFEGDMAGFSADAFLTERFPLETLRQPVRKAAKQQSSKAAKQQSSKAA